MEPMEITALLLDIHAPVEQRADAAHRAAALLAQGRLAPATWLALCTAVMEQTAQEDDIFRVTAMKALAQTWPAPGAPPHPHAKLRAHAVAALFSASASLRRCAVEILGACGVLDNGELRALGAVLQDPVESVAKGAKAALRRVGVHPAVAPPSKK